jgi:DNA-binding LacI/PurR family transcriptional regulator
MNETKSGTSSGGLKKASSMKQIARVVGVSQSTVSRVLNGANSRVPIAAETRRRVLETARNMGYRPNPLARGLRGSGTALLGLIVREISDPFFARAIEVITGRARGHGYNIVLCHAQSSAHEALVLAGVLETRHTDGIILLGDLHYATEVWTELVEGPLPVVTLCGGGRSPGTPTINTDNGLGVRMALDYLWDLGHRRIGYFDGGWLGDVAERREAYFGFLAEHQIELLDGYHQAAENDIGAGQEAFARILRLPDPPTAILCATDQVALGALAGALRAGVKVPSEISIVGFDDISLAQFSVPPLTTIRQPLDELAKRAVDEVVGIIRGEKEAVAEIKYLRPELVVRASCGPPRKKVLRIASQRASGARLDASSDR